MRRISFLGLFAILAATGSAQAGAPVPGPELGDGYAGLAVLAVVLGGYAVFRYLRTHRA